MKILGTNIISSLGFTANDNFNNVRAGISGIRRYEVGTFDLPEPFMASLIDKNILDDHFANTFLHNASNDRQQAAERLTALERAAVLSVARANTEANIDLSSAETLFVVSTTKGNIDSISSSNGAADNTAFLWTSARRIADFFGNGNTPITVSNACISGAAAQVAAMRQLSSGQFTNAVVVGMDFLSKFIISGFMSFKALAPTLCKPFDADRCGLNLGEAAATIIFGKATDYPPTGTHLINGAIRNDATHISAPSRVGEGSRRAIDHTLKSEGIAPCDIAFVSAHGTATPYNDAMEANAIQRTGLGDVPVNSLKSYFGHTLGAAGVLETIISAKALEHNLILPTLNCDTPEQIVIDDEPFSLNIPKEATYTDKKYFLKTLSGFGGINAALLLRKY